MARHCYNLKVGAFTAAAFNLLVGGLTLGGVIYKIAINQNGRVGLLVIMFLMSVLLIHNGVLMIIGIVMVNREYVILYLVLNTVNWLVGSFVIFKEMSGQMSILCYIGLSILLMVAWSLLLIVYKFYKEMMRRTFTEIEIEDKCSYF